MSISKELLSEVLEEKVLSYIIKNNEIFLQFHDYDDIINIYELAHKCKEWAKELEWTLQSGWNCRFMSKDYGHDDKGYYAILQNKDFETREFKGNREPEAIFKATQWILDNKANI